MVDMVRLLVGTVRKKIVGMPRLDIDMDDLVLQVALQMFVDKARLFADMVRWLVVVDTVHLVADLVRWVVADTARLVVDTVR